MGATESSLGSGDAKKFSGTVLIFSHRVFQHSSRKERKGTEKDHTNLKETLSTEYNLNVELFTDDESRLTTQNVLKKIEEYSEKIYRDDEKNCLVVFVLSHGEEGGKICSYDSTYLTSEIWEPLINCPAFKGKPKLFLFQACRGEKAEPIVIVKESENVSNDKPESNGTFVGAYRYPRLPTDPDVFIGYSTVENYTALRNIEYGSPFIETICNNLKSLNEPEELHEFMTRVINEVADRRGTEDQQDVSLIKKNDNPKNPGQDEDQDQDLNENNNRNKQVTLPEIPPEAKKLKLTPQIRAQTPCFISKMVNPFYIQKQQHPLTLINAGNSSQSSNEEGVQSEKRATIKKREKVYYKKANKQRGYALLFYIRPYLYTAQLMEKYLNFLHFDTKKIELLNTESFDKRLKKEREDKKVSDAPYLVLAIFAPVEIIKNGHLEECYIDVGRTSYPIRSELELHFVASKCAKLINKPKLFFIIDAKCGEESVIKIPKELMNVLESTSTKEPSKIDVTEHADMLFVHGSGQEYIMNLCRQLRLGAKEENENLFVVLRETLKDTPEVIEREVSSTSQQQEPLPGTSTSESKESDKQTLVPMYYESTLTKLLQFKRSMEFVNTPQKSVTYKFIIDTKKELDKFITNCEEHKKKLKNVSNINKIGIGEWEDIIKEATDTKNKLIEMLESMPQSKKLFLKNLPLGIANSVRDQIVSIIKEKLNLEVKKSDITRIKFHKKVSKHPELKHQDSIEMEYEDEPNDECNDLKDSDERRYPETSNSTTSSDNQNSGASTSSASLPENIPTVEKKIVLNDVTVTFKTIEQSMNLLYEFRKSLPIDKQASKTQFHILPFIQMNLEFK